MEAQTVARIDKATGLVLNIEMATPEWVDAQGDDPSHVFVAYTTDDLVRIGSVWAPDTGFIPPPAEPETFTVTAAQLTTMGVKAAAITTLRNAATAAEEAGP